MADLPNIKTDSTISDGEMWFMPRINVEYEMGECRVDPNDPNKAIGTIIAKVHVPNPLMCARIYGIGEPERLDGDVK